MQYGKKRNEALHKVEKIQELEGLQILNKSINKEWKIGLSELPMIEYSHMFRIKEKELMEKSIEGKKDWLLVVKLARELHEDKERVIDKFDKNEELREWIGLKWEKNIYDGNIYK